MHGCWSIAGADGARATAAAGRTRLRPSDRLRTSMHGARCSARSSILVGCGTLRCHGRHLACAAPGAYTAAKFPLLIFLTCAGNALLNGMLAQLLGSGLSFRQTSAAILMSFATAAVVLGALSPITLFVIDNAPPLSFEHARHRPQHHAFDARLPDRLRRRAREPPPSGSSRSVSGNRAIARRVLVSWLAGNLLLGAQLAWVLRPFIGSPQLAVQFLRDDPLRGNFYEAVCRALAHLFS